MPIEIGQVAPDFTLRDQFGQSHTLSDLRGKKNVVLVFYPFAFTPTCTGELCAIRDEKSDFDNDEVVTFGISCDTVASLKVYAEREGLDYSILSDFWPHGAVSRDYGVFLEAKGFSTRGTFIIDKAGVVRWAVITTPGDARSNDDYRKALAEIG